MDVLATALEARMTKFFLHRGSYSRQNVGSRVQPLGSDVNLVHRITKNTVPLPSTCWRRTTVQVCPSGRFLCVAMSLPDHR